MSYDSQTSTSLINKLRKDVDSLTLKIATLSDQKPSGTDGGSVGATSTWQTRTINTIDSDPNGLVLDLTNNEFTLAAGAYQIRAVCPFHHSSETRTRLYDVTNSVVIGYGSSAFVANNEEQQIAFNLRVQPHKDNVYRIEFWATSNVVTTGLGIPSGNGTNEVYSTVEITRLDTGMTKPQGGSGVQGPQGPAGPAGPTGPAGPAGSGTVTSVSVVSANGVSGTVATATTTPAITLALGAITPTSVAASGAISAGATVTGSNLSGVNTGDQVIILGGDRMLTEGGDFLTSESSDYILETGDVTGSGTGRITTTITPQAVTYDKMQWVSATNRILGRQSANPGVIEEITCTAAGRAILDDATATDQRTTLGAAASGAITGSGLTVSANNRLVGRVNSSGAVEEISLGSGISFAGTVLSATGTGGTVTSVNADGSTTGMTFSGGPITGSGTLTLGGTLGVSNGGTGATTAASALTSLGAYPATNPNGYTSNVGTVTTASVVTANGVSGTVATATTTPAITISLGAITPTSVAASGTVTGSNLTGTHTGTSSGTNTGDQTITLTGDVTGTGTGTFSATIGNNKVTYGKIQATSASSVLLGSNTVGTTVQEITLGSGLSMSGNTLNATATGSGDVTGPSVSVDGDLAVFNGTTGKIIKVGTTTGTGNVVRATSPVLLTPNIGTPSAGTLTNCTFPVRIQDTGITCTTARVLGRSTAGTGSVEQLTLGAGLSISAGVLNTTGTGSGDVVGPAGATDGNFVLFDGSTGKLIKGASWNQVNGDIKGPGGFSSMPDGFVYIPASTANPSATPTNVTGSNVPLYFNTNSNTLWVHNGTSWKSVSLL